MNLTNMKLSHKEKEVNTETVSSDKPEYPWGLEIDLNEESLEKLEWFTTPKAGQKVIIMARAEVIRTSESQSQEFGESHTHRSVSLQITDLALDPESEKKDAGALLYGEGE